MQVRIVQSFWSCQQKDLLKFGGGWLSPEFNLMSWALSCLQLRQFYPEVTLHADSVAAKMLIDILKLPYDKIICDLDYLNTYHPQLWALPKIHTYSKQQSPFLHVDGDVFIYNHFDKGLLQNGLIAQNEESATIYYENILKSLEAELSYFPEEIIADRKSKNPVHAFNAGIFGGNDIDFFGTYCLKAFQFVENNSTNFSKINVSNFNIFFEQYLFYCLAKQNNKKVSVLIDDVIGDNMYKGFGDFVDVPYKRHYLHLLGDYKRNSSVCTHMANRLRQDHPEYYYRIIALFKNTKVPLLKDYYLFEQAVTEKGLLQKHHFLKAAYAANNISVAGENTERKWLRESVYYRASVLNATLEYAGKEVALKNPEFRTADLSQFEDAIFDIVSTKFSQISGSYLLARDISSTGYSEYIFGDKDTIYNKVIVADNQAEKIKSQFDWAAIDTNDSPTTIGKLVEAAATEVHTLVIPECDQHGYSLVSIDELDLLILQTIQEPKSIKELFAQIMFAFDADDLESSKSEFEELIFGRIKNGLMSKSIKAVKNFAV